MDATLIGILAQVLKAFELTHRISNLSIEANIMAARTETNPKLDEFFPAIEAKRIEIAEQRSKCYQLLDEALNRLASVAKSKQMRQSTRSKRKTSKTKHPPRQ